MLSEKQRTIEYDGNMKIVDGRVYRFAGEWRALGEANVEDRAFAARHFYSKALSAEDRDDAARADEYRAEMMRYGGLPWADLKVYDDDGDELDGDAKAAALREYRDTGAMAGAWLTHPGATPEEREAASYKGPKSTEVNWSGLPD
jgi:hypothetical protein